MFIYEFLFIFLYSGKVLVPVVIDPMLAQKLRPHQKQGVQFLWNTVAVGQRLNNQLCQGCILADEMYEIFNSVLCIQKTCSVHTDAHRMHMFAQYERPHIKFLFLMVCSILGAWARLFSQWRSHIRCCTRGKFPSG